MNVPLPETSKFIPTPADLLALAAEMPEVGAAIREWKSGTLTWEQALIRALIDSNRARHILSRVVNDKAVVPHEVRDAILAAMGLNSWSKRPEQPLVI